MVRIIIGTLLVIWGLSALLGFSLFRFVFAVIVILIGVSIISGRRHWAAVSAPSSSDEDYINEVAVMSAVNKASKSAVFRGGRLVLVFAGGEIDLREAKAASKEIDLQVTSVFGGAKIVIPKNWRVNVQGTAIIGGFDSKAEAGTEATLNLKGAAIFGGVEIIN